MGPIVSWPAQIATELQKQGLVSSDQQQTYRYTEIRDKQFI